jgi:hypothetical protein
MKKRLFSIYSVIAVLLVGIVFAGMSCKKFSDITEGTKLIVDFSLIETSIDVRVFDAKTGNLIGQDGDGNVSIRITGADKDGVVDATGLQPENQQYTTQKGMLGLGLNPASEYTPSQMRRVSFNIVAHADGYLSTSQHVSISATGKNFVRINMVALDNPPEGVTVVREENVGTLVGGQLEEPLLIVTPGGKAELTIPAGVLMKDADGTLLQGNLDVLLVHFDNAVEEALAAFPGGLMTNATTLDGNSTDGMFFSAGFVAIEIKDANDRQAKTFEGGTLGLLAEVSPETYNPFAQRNVAAGDEVPFWSYDENTGSWTEEGNYTVTNNAGVFELSAEISHLSYFNFDWFWTEFCYYGVDFEFVVQGEICDCFPLQGIMRRQSDNAFIAWVEMWVCQGEPVHTFFAPANMPVYIEWLDNLNPTISVDAQYQPTYIEDLCEDITVTVYLTAIPYGTTVTAEVEVYCPSDPDFIIRPNFGVWYHKSGDINNWRYAEMVNGFAEICGVELGETYYFFAYYDGNYYYEPFTVTEANYEYVGFELPAEVCDEVFGM